MLDSSEQLRRWEVVDYLCLSLVEVIIVGTKGLFASMTEVV